MLALAAGAGGDTGGSVSSGAGGGVVSIVQPIHPEMTRTSKTNRRTGIPIAHCAQDAGRPTYGAKKAAKYTRAMTIDIMKIAKP